MSTLAGDSDKAVSRHRVNKAPAVVCSKPLQLTCKKLLVYHQVPPRASLAWRCMSTLAGDSDKAVSRHRVNKAPAVVCNKPFQLTCKKLLVYHQVPSRVSLAWQCM